MRFEKARQKMDRPITISWLSGCCMNGQWPALYIRVRLILISGSRVRSLYIGISLNKVDIQLSVHHSYRLHLSLGHIFFVKFFSRISLVRPNQYEK